MSQRLGLARSLALSVALGTALFAVVRATSGPELRPFKIAVPANATPIEAAHAIDRALILEAGRATGALASDPIIHERLIQNMRFSEGLGPGESATVAADRDRLKRALALGMDRSDPVVIQRLEWLGKQALTGARDAPTEAELRAFWAAHPQRYTAEPRRTLHHIFWASASDDGPLKPRLQSLRVRLKPISPGPATAALGDPFMHGAVFEYQSPANLSQRFGPALMRNIESSPERQWVGPFKSVFGWHLCWIERFPAAPQDFETLQPRLLMDVKTARAHKSLAAALARRRAQVMLVLVETP